VKVDLLAPRCDHHTGEGLVTRHGRERFLGVVERLEADRLRGAEPKRETAHPVRRLRIRVQHEVQPAPVIQAERDVDPGLAPAPDLNPLALLEVVRDPVHHRQMLLHRDAVPEVCRPGGLDEGTPLLGVAVHHHLEKARGAHPGRGAWKGGVLRLNRNGQEQRGERRSRTTASSFEQGQ
jgi:hypothetical protein